MDASAFDHQAAISAGPAVTVALRHTLARLDQNPALKPEASWRGAPPQPSASSPATPPRSGLAPWQVKRARAYIDAQLADHPSLAQLAKQVRLSTGHCGRAFRRSFGQSYAQFVRGARVQRAQQLMLATDLRLCDVSGLCGFSDQAHFSRTFRQQTGFPPAQWRRRAAI